MADFERFTFEQWQKMTDAEKHTAAKRTITRALAAAMDKGPLEPWTAYHLDVAVKAMNDRMFGAVVTYAQKANLEEALRAPIANLQAQGLPTAEHLRDRMFEAIGRTEGHASTD